MIKGKTMRHNKERAQTMVEFALALPVFLLLVLGIMEVGRAILFSISVNTAAREGARYGAAAGEGNSGVIRYADCDGIRSAALKIGGIVGLTNSNITVTYDKGPGTAGFGNCSAGNTGPNLAKGDRIVVTVSSNFKPVVPLVNLPAFQVSSTSRRTIIKDVEIK